MFLRILKKDLKRKKTMNIILLLFVILCSMFAAASVSTIFAVTGGIDSYFDMAEVPDILMSIPLDSDLDAEIAALPMVSGIKTEHLLSVLDSGCFVLDGKKLENFTNTAVISDSSERAIKYFDADNRPLPEIKEGSFWATAVFSNGLDIRAGDTLTFNAGDQSLELKYMGVFKDAVSGNTSTDHPHLLFSPEDYEKIKDNPSLQHWAQKALFISASDPDEIVSRYGGMQSVYTSTRSELKGIFLYDMIVAYTMMAISVLLLIAGFVVLRFTIGFTISEEFREIGVMKAVGIDNGSIRRIYLVKYSAISVIGSLLGYLFSIPLSEAMLKNVSDNMVFGGENKIYMGLISSAAVIAAIILFCYLCTRRVSKLSPIDAVRNGQTGERFGRRSFMHLGRSRLPVMGFLAANDVTSAPRQFIIITLIFTLSILMTTLMSVFGETLKSEELVPLFGTAKSDITLGDVSILDDILNGKGCDPTIEKYEKLLAENGMPGKAIISLGASYELTCGDRKEMINLIVTKGVPDEETVCDEGSPPLRDDEIALTGKAMELLGAGIGDTVKVTIGGTERELMVTGKISTFMNGGKAGRLSSVYDHDPDKINNCMGIQIRFDGSPDKATKERYIEKLKDLMGSGKVFSNSELVESITGLSSTMTSMKHMMMILTAIVTALVVILMERSFISKEKSEIALMKAIGIGGGSIIAQHVLRFVIVALLAAGLASALLYPLSGAMLNWVFSMIGDIKSSSIVSDSFDVFFVCPALVIAVSAAGSFLTALYTGSVKASDTASIE